MRLKAAPQIERRASPRLQIISYIVGELDTGDEVSLMNISEGGLMVRCTHRASVGEMHEFRFQPDADAVPLVFAARIIHVQQLPNTEPREYELGLQFMAQTKRQREAIRRLLACVADPARTTPDSEESEAAQLPIIAGS